MEKGLTSEDIYKFIQPHLGDMEFTKGNKSVYNLEKRYEIINFLLEDVFNTYNQTNNRPEASAMVLRRNIKDMFNIISERITRSAETCKNSQINSAETCKNLTLKL
jgi:hypothetical protein